MTKIDPAIWFVSIGKDANKAMARRITAEQAWPTMSREIAVLDQVPCKNK